MLRGGACYGDLPRLLRQGRLQLRRGVHARGHLHAASRLRAGRGGRRRDHHRARLGAQHPDAGARPRRRCRPCASPACAGASPTAPSSDAERRQLVRAGRRDARLRRHPAPARGAVRRARAASTSGSPAAESSSPSEHIWQQEFAWAREHGLPITAHCDDDPARHGATGARSRSTTRHGVLGPDLLLVHCIQADDDEIGWLAGRAHAGLDLDPVETCAAAWACRRRWR